MAGLSLIEPMSILDTEGGAALAARAELARDAGRPAPAAVGVVGAGVHLAAVVRVAVAVGEARGAGRDAAGARGARAGGAGDAARSDRPGGPGDARRPGGTGRARQAHRTGGAGGAGGAGRALAEWIVNGSPTTDLTGVDIRRFAPFNGNVAWLHDRVAEVLGVHYEIPWPNRELTTARPFRRSPVHHLLVAANANFGSRMGWERANFFAPPGTEPVIEYSWGKQNWLDWSAAEQLNTRTGVTVFDQTSFSKYLLAGPDAERALQWLCTADVAVPVGRSVYTGMLNERGTYESDVTVTRTGATEFLIVSSAATTEESTPPESPRITSSPPAAWATTP